MKVFHHIDNDGLCAAAIVRRALINPYLPPPGVEDFIPYNYEDTIKIPEFRENEEVYIVDLSLTPVLMDKVIRPALEANAKVIHIDHHDTSVEVYDEYVKNNDFAVKSDRYIPFFKTGFSGCLLTWIYTSMQDDEKIHPMDVDVDCTEDRVVFAFYPEDKMKKRGDYKIPDAIRYIDDNDVWRHKLKDTEAFKMGLGTVVDKHPCSDIWKDLLYSSNQHETSELVNTGIGIVKYQENVNRGVFSFAFESNISEHKALCLNTPFGNSKIFGINIHTYPICCKFHYDGINKIWRYSLYSSDLDENAVDVSEIAKSYGGGGHKHAAGFSHEELILI